MEKSGRWYFEPITPGFIMGCTLDAVVYSGKTPYQTVAFLDTSPFGRCLILDGKTQSAEADEHLYHEALVHPSLLFHPGPGVVFIGGGGEGATLREVLAHRSVRRAVMVDLDREVVELCRRFLPGHHQGAFDDPRAQIHYQDAREFLAATAESFDVIILDLADPTEGGPAYRLYTQEFYELALQRLAPQGILVTQAGPAGPLNCTEALTPIAHTLASVFSHTYPYSVFVPSFGGTWGFVLATSREEPLKPPADAVDQLIAQRLRRSPRFYDGITHQGIFSLPRYLREALKEEKRLVTDSNPVFVL